MVEKPKKAAISFTSNLDYDKTYENLKLCSEIGGLYPATGAGIIFWVKDSPKFHVRISPKAAVVITCANMSQLNIALNILRTYGVPSEGDEVKLVYKTRFPWSQELKMLIHGHYQHVQPCAACIVENIGFETLKQAFQKAMAVENVDVILQRVDWSKLTLQAY
ncbi:MAG: hypothetical protein ACKD6O_08250 [Candidatus Bathyarchaeota archaeon]